MTIDEKYMRRCIQLARNGICHAAPNPMVGAVIVRDGKIIGEGYHVRCGEGHAEVNAIASVKDESLLKDATIYVSLEPCSHYGKTPPCADLIIRKGIPRVVVGCVDPFSLVAGRGIQKLRDAGIEATVGVLEKECRELIRAFVTFNLKKRPYITLKWAQSADGFLDIRREDGNAVRLSTPLSTLAVHKMRAEQKVIDRQLTLPPHLHLFDGSTPTLVFTEKEKAATQNLTYVTLDFGQNILPQIMQVLYEQKIQTLLVEGGSQTLQAFLEQGLWDEAFIEHARVTLHDGIPAPLLPHGQESRFFFRDGALIQHCRHAE